MSTPGYTPPPPPVGTHAGQVTPPAPDAVASLTDRVRRLQVLAGVAVAVSLVSLALAVWGLLPGRAGSAVPAAAPTASQPGVAASPSAPAKPRPEDAGPLPTGAIAVGSVGQGKPVLDIYEDFQCPACASAEAHFGPEVDQLVASGTVEVRYHMMSFLDQMLKNDSSVRAAHGGFCADDQGKFLAYHDQLFANHPATEGTGWTDAQLASYAGKAGLDVAQWQQCLASGKHLADVKQANDGSLASGVNSTPTYRINGAKVDLQAVANAGGLKVVIDSLR